MEILSGTVRAYDAGTHTATVEIDGAPDAWLPGLPVNRGLDAAELVAGRRALVVFTSGTNPADAMLVGVY